MNIILAILRADEIVVAIFLVDPKRGREVGRAVERSDDVFDNLFLGQPDLCGFDAINVDVDLRRVEPLLNARIDGAGDGFGEALNFFRDVVGDLEFVAFNLNVDGRRQTAVERGAEHPASVEVELGAGKLLRQFFSQLIDIGKSRAPMMLGELDKNERVLRPGVGRVSSRPVEQHAEIRNDDLAVLFGNDSPDRFLDLRHKFFRLLDPQSGRGAHLHGELSGIGLREKFRADGFQNKHRQNEERGRSDEHRPAQIERALERT